MAENAAVAATLPPVPSQRRVLIVVGQTGSGKSFLARTYLKSKTRVLIADADFREYGAREFTPPGGAGFDAMLEYLKAHAGAGGFFRVSYTPSQEEFPLVCEIARHIGPVDFVIEECDRFPDPQWCPDYEEIIARGRHWGVSITALSRNPFAIPVSLRREANRIIAFRQQEPRDLDWLSDVIGREAAAQLPKLGPHEFIEWTPENGALPRRKLAPGGKDFC